MIHLYHGNNLVLLLILSTTFLTLSSAMPPPNPVKCINSTCCELSNSYGFWNDRQTCRAPKVVYPTTEEQLRQELANANKNNLKVKIVTKSSHTIPKLACPSTRDNAVLISTEKYDTTINVDVEKRTVVADGGVGLRKLIDTVEKNGLSLVAAPYWEGVTVAGVISTGAHGSSSWGKGGAVHDHVIGLSLVVPANKSEGYAKIVELVPQDPLFKAAQVSLGLLGIISKVTFQLEPAFKRSVTYNFTNDSGIENDFMEHAKKNEFGDIQWYPSRHTAVYRYDNRVTLNTSGDGVNDFLPFQSNLILLSQSTRATEKGFENTRNVSGKCIMASSSLADKKLLANGLKNSLTFTEYPVVGHQGKMQTSGSCLYSSPSDITSTCAWDPRINGLLFYEFAAKFPASRFSEFILDVKKLRDLVRPERMCGVDIYNGFVIRFIKASDAYLGQDEDSVVSDFSYYRADDALTPRFYQDIWEEVEQIAFFKYGAKPHWGKNRNAAFIDVQKKYPKFDKFVAAKKKLDPKNMLSSEWSDEILFGKQQSTKGDGCALEGMCICSEDRHCSPSEGYFCKPGLVYQQARVCRLSSSASTS